MPRRPPCTAPSSGEKPLAETRRPPSAILVNGAVDDELTMQLRSVLEDVPFAGTLDRNSTRDESMEGLITCELALHVRIAESPAFSVDARGGGFTERAAERQARERLSVSLQKKIDEWRTRT